MFKEASNFLSISYVMKPLVCEELRYGHLLFLVMQRKRLFAEDLGFETGRVWRMSEEILIIYIYIIILGQHEI